MDLKSRIEVMHTLDQLSDGQFSTLVAKVLAGNRDSTSRMLRNHFIKRNDTILADSIKQTSQELLHADKSDEEDISPTCAVIRNESPHEAGPANIKVTPSA